MLVKFNSLILKNMHRLVISTRMVRYRPIRVAEYLTTKAVSQVHISGQWFIIAKYLNTKLALLDTTLMTTIVVTTGSSLCNVKLL